MIHQELSLAPHLTVTENIVLGVEPVRGRGPAAGDRRSRPDARDGARGARAARPPRHRARSRRSASCRRRRSSSSRSRARSPSAAACSCSTSRRAASGTATSSALRAHQPAEGAGASRSSTSRTSSKRCRRSPIASSSCATDGTPARARRATRRRGTSSRMMVGRARSMASTRGRARAPGEAVLELDGARAWRGAARRCTAARSLGIAGLIGAGRTRLLRRDLRPRARAKAGRIARRRLHRARPPHDRWRQGMGLLSEDRKDEGLAAGLSIADNLTLTRLVAVRAARSPSGPARQDAPRPRWIDRLAHPLRATRARRSPSSPAATSRRSRSRACCITTWTCSCSTSRRAGSTSAARRRSTG